MPPHSTDDAAAPAAQPDPDRREEQPLRERLDALRAAHPLPAPTGLKADKAFFDWLCGEEDA
ncbi:MAG: hypothetical protein K2X74_08150 [Acetobacteraceae bacterium]|nr:hypothetical protein [Acetobacteraceae bacterium]